MSDLPRKSDISFVRTHIGYGPRADIMCLACLLAYLHYAPTQLKSADTPLTQQQHKLVISPHDTS
jgi:hypothetical protein